MCEQAKWQRQPGGISRRNGDHNAINRSELFGLSSSFPNADRLRVGKRPSKAATSTEPESSPKFAKDAAKKQNRLIKKAGMEKILNCRAQNTDQRLCIYIELRDGSGQIRVALRSKKGAMCARGEITLGPNQGMGPGWEQRLANNVQECISAYKAGKQAA